MTDLQFAALLKEWKEVYIPSIQISVPQISYDLQGYIKKIEKLITVMSEPINGYDSNRDLGKNTFNSLVGVFQSIIDIQGDIITQLEARSRRDEKLIELFEGLMERFTDIEKVRIIIQSGVLDLPNLDKELDG